MKPIRLVSLAALAAVLWLGLLIIPQPNAAFSSLAQATTPPTFVPTVDLSDYSEFATPVPIPTLSITITPSGPPLAHYVLVPKYPNGFRTILLIDVQPERFGKFTTLPKSPEVSDEVYQSWNPFPIVLQEPEAIYLRTHGVIDRVRFFLEISYTYSEEIAYQAFWRMRYTRLQSGHELYDSSLPTAVAGSPTFIYSTRIGGTLSDLASTQFRNVIVTLKVVNAGGLSPAGTLERVGLTVEEVAELFRDVKAFMLRCPMLINCLPAGE